MAVFKSCSDVNSLVAVVDAKDKSQRQIITILRDTECKVNVIPSMYGKDNFNNFVAGNIKEGNLLYIDQEKALKTIRPQELQLLKEDNLKDSIENIQTKEDVVKRLNQKVCHVLAYRFENKDGILLFAERRFGKPLELKEILD